MHAIARFLTCHRDVGIPKTALGRARVVYGSASGERAFATGMLSVLLSTGKKERALYNLYVIFLACYNRCNKTLSHTVVPL